MNKFRKLGFIDCNGVLKVHSSYANAQTVAIVAGGADLYQLHKDGAIWRYTGVRCNGPGSCPGWEQLDDNIHTKQIIAAENQLYQLHDDGTIWRYCNGGCSTWQQLGINYSVLGVAASLDAN